jgi:hypothetical protein
MMKMMMTFEIIVCRITFSMDSTTLRRSGQWKWSLSIQYHSNSLLMQFYDIIAFAIPRYSNNE